jgi:hypothetical protein
MNQDSAAFLRAIKGPVMMITVGVLFALDNFTSLSFGRTWPVLLVVAGLLNMGRSAYRKDPLRGKFQYRAQWGPPQRPAPPPPPPASSSVPPTAGPGTYRGSAYEATPGSPPRSSESRSSESKETRSSARDPGATQ